MLIPISIANNIYFLVLGLLLGMFSGTIVSISMQLTMMADTPIEFLGHQYSTKKEYLTAVKQFCGYIIVILIIIAVASYIIAVIPPVS